jgi:hypothetical protein
MSGWARTWAALALSGAWTAATSARAEDVTARAADRPWSVAADLGATLVSRSSTASTSVRLARAQALGVTVDRSFDRLQLFARAEANTWRERRDDGTNDFALTIDLGVGAGVVYGGGRLGSSFAAGASLLAVPTDVDEAGAFGAFADVRPLSYAWAIGQRLRVGVVPLSLTLAVPVLTGIPLVSIQYRTTVFVEHDL